jgi:hypothetical protein
VVGSASAFKEKTMCSMIVRGAASCALLALSLAAVAQQAKFEIQGNAATESRKNDAIARAITEEIGAPPAGKGQVVFFRTARSPGSAIPVSGDGMAVGELPAGMYFATPAVAGTHAYSPGDGGGLSVQVRTGQTHYVQVIRNRAGQPKLVRTTATMFQRATQH